MSLSPRNTLLAAGNIQDKDLSIWNYEVLGLLKVIEMEHPVVTVHFSQHFDLLSIATSDGKVHFLKYIKKEHDLNLTLLQVIDLNNENPTDMVLSFSQETNRHECLVTTMSGEMFNFDITNIINQHFTMGEQVVKESVNILRNQREEFETSFSQRGHRQLINSIAREEE